MESEDILNNELNPASLPGSSNSSIGSPQSNKKSESWGKKFSGFLKANKGKIAGFGGGGIIGAVLMMFGSMLSGPMQIIHAGQVVGEVVQTVRDLASGVGLGRNTFKIVTGKASKGAIRANSRLSLITQIPTKNFEKKLAEAGVEIVADKFGWATGLKVSGNSALTKLVEEGGEMTAKQLRKGLGVAIDAMPNNKLYKFIMERSIKKKYGIRVLDGIKKVPSKVYKAIAEPISKVVGKTISSLQEWVVEKQRKRGADLIARGMSDAGAKLISRADEAAELIGKGTITAFASKLLGSIGSKVIKFLPVIGWLIGVGVDYLVDQWIDEKIIEEVLVQSALKAMEIATTADDIRNDTVPTESEKGEYMPSQLYMEMIAAQNIYMSYDTAGESDFAALGNNTYAASGDYCSDFIDDPEAYKVCIDSLIQQEENSLSSLDKNTKIGSSFFTNTPLQAEFNSNYVTDQEDPEYYRGVPKKLAGVGKDTRLDSLLNAIIGSVTLFGPKDIADFMEESFDVEELNPADMGGASMYGARVLQNDLSLSEGAEVKTVEEEASILRETQTYLAEQQMEKSWFARMFDIEDYHSGIATLSRDAEWDLSNSSFTTQFANVFRTFAAIPKLISKSFNTYTRAAADTNPVPYAYGFNMVAYTTDDINAQPDYWDAEEFLLDDTNYNNINTTELAECTGAVITKDEYGIKVAWSEQTKVKNMEVSSKQRCTSYFNDKVTTFESYDAYGDHEKDEPKAFYGEDAVRTILANYKTMAAFAATSFDELEEDGDLDDALSEAEMDKNTAEYLLTCAMVDLGIDYSEDVIAKCESGSIGGGPGEPGEGNMTVVEAASEITGLSCVHCVAFVNSVYQKAYGINALNCGTGTIGGYSYCPGFEITNNPVPGDIIVYGSFHDGCGHYGDGTLCHVAIMMPNGRVSEAGGGRCRINSDPWYTSGITGYIHYTGGD